MSHPFKYSGDGTPQHPFDSPINRQSGFCTFSGSAPTASTYAHRLTKPQTDPTNGVYVLEIPAANQIALSFWGNAAGDIEAYVYGIREKVGRFTAAPGTEQTAREFIGTYLGKLTATVGSAAADSASKLYPDGTLFANAIAVNTDNPLGGWDTFGDGVKYAIADVTGIQHLVVVLKGSIGMGFDWAGV